MKKSININLTTQNILLAGAFVALALYVDSQISSAYLLSAEDNGIPPDNPDYIQRFKRAVAANDYAVIKSLYKLKSAVEDISSIDFASSCQSSQEEDISRAVREIRPFMSTKSCDSFDNIMAGIQTAKTTFERINESKSRIDGTSSDGQKGERIKAVINELPNIASSPQLDRLFQMKDALSLLKPLIASNPPDSPYKAISDVNREDTQDEDTNERDYLEIMELLELMDEKKN